MKPSEMYPDLVEENCRNCRLECNVCQHCNYGIKEFLECDLVPKECPLKPLVKNRFEQQERNRG